MDRQVYRHPNNWMLAINGLLDGTNLIPFVQAFFFQDSSRPSPYDPHGPPSPMHVNLSKGIVTCCLYLNYAITRSKLFFLSGTSEFGREGNSGMYSLHVP